MTEYTWTTPSGVTVTSCKPYRRDEWTRFGPVWYGVRSYWHLVQTLCWKEPRKRKALRAKGLWPPR